MKFKIPLTSRQVVMFTRKLRNKPVKGIVSKTQDDLHIIMMDYDDCSIDGSEYEILQIIESDIKRLIKKYKLSNFYIINSNYKKFHTVCFSKVPLNKYIDICKDSSCDYRFARGLVTPYNGVRAGVLRIAPKNVEDYNPRMVKVVEGCQSKNMSQAHALSYSAVLSYNVIEKHPGNYDNGRKCYKITYGV